MSAGYTALLERVALLPDEARAVVALRGPQTLRALNGLLTNDLAPLERGVGVYSFALTPKGRPIADMRVLPWPGGSAGGDSGAGADSPADSAADAAADTGAGPNEPPWPGGIPGPGESGGTDERVWLDLPHGAADALLGHFGRFVPPFFSRYERVDAGRLSLVGPEWPRAAAAAWRALGSSEPERGHPVHADAEPLATGSADAGADPDGRPAAFVVRREPIEGDGLDFYAATADLEELRQRLAHAVEEAGGALATGADWEGFRIESGLPLFGREISEQNLPQETGQTERAVSFSKGCYTGQEVVARIHYRGHVNRVLRGVEPLPNPADAAGLELFDGDRRVGHVTSGAESPRLGAIGLAYIRREIEPGARLATTPGAEPAVVVHELPFTSR